MDKRSDLYTTYAAKLFAVPENKVTSAQRKLAKCALYWQLYSSPMPFAQVKLNTETQHKEQKTMNERLEYIAEILESWAEGQLNPPETYYGICASLAYGCKLLVAGCAGIVAAAAKSWPEFSGDAEYPVPHEYVSPESAYTATHDIPKWGDDAYGQARRRLCQHIADWIRANPEAATKFLRED